MASTFLPFRELKDADDGSKRHGLSVGDSCDMLHVGCSDKPKVTLTRLSHGNVWYCHKCHGTGFARERNTYGVYSHPEPAPTIVMKDPAPWRALEPIDATSNGAEWIEQFAGGSDLWKRFYPDLRLGMDGERMVFEMRSPILDSAHPVTWRQVRRFDGMEPKWRTFLGYDGPKLPWVADAPSFLDPGEEKRLVILVEDVVSAMAIRNLLSDGRIADTTVASMNGLVLSFEASLWLSENFAAAAVLADKDAAGIKDGATLARELRPMFYDRVSFRPAGNPSPKNMTSGELAMLIDKLRGEAVGNGWI